MICIIILTLFIGLCAAQERNRKITYFNSLLKFFPNLKAYQMELELMITAPFGVTNFEFGREDEEAVLRVIDEKGGIFEKNFKVQFSSFQYKILCKITEH